MHETEGIVEYHERFELIKTRVNLLEEYLVSAYLAGLRMDTQMHARMFQPQSIRQCLLLEKFYEKAHPSRNVNAGWTNTKPIGSNNQGKGLLTTKKEFENKGGFSSGNVVQKNMSVQPKKFMSTEEMNERRAKGLCYFCDKKYSPDHYLKHKKKNSALYDESR